MGKFDERAEEFGMLVGVHESARRVEDLPLEWVTPDQGNPRIDFDEQQLAELAASIKARGVLLPIVVGPRNSDGKHVIRMGERRYRASLAAGLKTIPAIVSEVGQGVDILADQIVENDQRTGLTARELALGVERMLKDGQSQTQIAAALGRSKQFVSLYAAYGEMEPFLRDAIGKAPIRVLYDLHRAARQHPEQVRSYVSRMRNKGLTLAEGSRFVATLRADKDALDPMSQAEPRTEIRPGSTAKGRGGSGKTSSDWPPIRVRVGDRLGQLLLPTQVQVKFDDGEICVVPVTDIARD